VLKMPFLNIRVSKQLKLTLEAKAKEAGKTLSDLTREALEAFAKEKPIERLELRFIKACAYPFKCDRCKESYPKGSPLYWSKEVKLCEACRLLSMAKVTSAKDWIRLQLEIRRRKAELKALNQRLDQLYAKYDLIDKLTLLNQVKTFLALIHRNTVQLLDGFYRFESEQGKRLMEDIEDVLSKLNILIGELELVSKPKIVKKRRTYG